MCQPLKESKHPSEFGGLSTVIVEIFMVSVFHVMIT